VTPEEYLAIERAAEFRSEYHNGRMYATAGTSYRHAILVSNLVFTLNTEIGDRPCSVTSTDLRLRVQPGGLYTYPDIVVVCGEPKFADNQRDTLLNPTLIMEVLSP
jgi:Uma2 family endonuclease